MRKIIIISLLLLTIYSCENKFPDYVKKDQGIYMKLLSFEEEGKGVNVGDHVVASIEIMGEEGLLYRRYKEDVINLENNKFNFLINYLNEGDSCKFMVSKARIMDEFSPISFNETSSDFLEVTIKIYEYLTKGEYLSQREAYDKEMMEQLILTKYLEEVNAKLEHGIYKEQLITGSGKGIEKGDHISINYKGYFVSRLEFDNTYKRNAFTFTYGTPGQVIKGLDIAISGMKKGEKSKIIIPSQLAFGEKGSTTLIVPAFSTVIYELEIVNVK